MEQPNAQTQKTKNKSNSSNSKNADAPQKKSGYVLKNLIGMACVILLLIVFAVAGLNLYTRHGQEIKMPNLKGMSEVAAIHKLEELGLTVAESDSVYVKSIPVNAIYEQSIQPGEPIKKGRIVRLTVNSGNPPQLLMPDIADNCSLREATARLTSLGFKLGPTEYIKGEKDWVYEVKTGGHNVGAGSRIKADDIIVLVVGNGTYYNDDVELQDASGGDSIFSSEE